MGTQGRRSWIVLATSLALAAQAAVAAPALANASVARPTWAPETAQAADPPHEVTAFINAVYQDLFGRAPDDGGMATWTRALLSGTPYGEVANAITYSNEYRSRLIRDAFEHYLGRAPDPAGLAFWLGQMRNGWHIEEIQAGFIASAEFYARWGSTPSGWVTGLYRTVLARDPGLQELNWWVSRIREGRTRGEVARGFLYSTEHLTAVVDGYYVKLLNRHIDPSGRVTWVRRIQAGHRDEAIIAGIVASAEYRLKAARIPPTPNTYLVGPTGNPSNLRDWSLSHDGRWVIFESSAVELVGSDVYRSDVFLWDRTTGDLTLVSKGADGAPPNNSSWHPSISADGRWITFCSRASNLVAGDDNGKSDVFVWDRDTGEMSRLPLGRGGAWSDFFYDTAISADGRWITYAMTASMFGAVYVADRLDGTTRLVSAAPDGSPADAHSSNPSISGDGRWIIYESEAANLVADDSNDLDVFLWDRDTGTTTLVSTPVEGTTFDLARSGTISADGRWLAYVAGRVSEPLGDRDAYLVDRTTGTRSSLPTPAPTGRLWADSLWRPTLSANGRWVAYNSGSDVAVMDRVTGVTSIAPGGRTTFLPADFFQLPVISGDGKWILFESSAPDLVDGDTNGRVDLFVTRNPLAPR